LFIAQVQFPPNGPFTPAQLSDLRLKRAKQLQQENEARTRGLNNFVQSLRASVQSGANTPLAGTPLPTPAVGGASSSGLPGLAAVNTAAVSGSLPAGPPTPGTILQQVGLFV
jgi:hypothetical protein